MDDEGYAYGDEGSQGGAGAATANSGGGSSEGGSGAASGDAGSGGGSGEAGSNAKSGEAGGGAGSGGAGSGAVSGEAGSGAESGGRSTGGESSQGSGGTATGSAGSPEAGAATCAGDDCCGACGGDEPVCDNGVCVARERGDACDNGDECDTGHCVDGVCCDSACTGQCESCSETPGTCQAVSTPRTPCNGSGTCAGSCDGSNGKSCVYPSTQTACASASCSDGSVTPAASCNGSGSCSTPTPTTCPFGCLPNGTACSECRQKSGSNLLQNPGFDGNASGWTSVGGAAYQPNRDAENCSASGSVLIETLAHEIKQCRPAAADTFYSFGFRFRGTGPGTEPSSFCAMIFYQGSGCSTASATSNIVTVTALGNLTTWVQGTGSAQSPPDAGSVLIDCAGQGGFGYYDQFFLSSTNATF